MWGAIWKWVWDHHWRVRNLCHLSTGGLTGWEEFGGGAVPSLISQIPHFLCLEKSYWFGFAGFSPGRHFILISPAGWKRPHWEDREDAGEVQGEFQAHPILDSTLFSIFSLRKILIFYVFVGFTYSLTSNRQICHQLGKRKQFHI